MSNVGLRTVPYGGTLRYYAHVHLSWLSSLGCAVVRVKSNGYPESNLGKKYH